MLIDNFLYKSNRFIKKSPEKKITKEEGENGEDTGRQYRHPEGEKNYKGIPPDHPIHPDNQWLRRIRQQPSNTPEQERGDFPRSTSYQQHFGRHHDDLDPDQNYLAGDFDEEWPYRGMASGGATAQHRGTSSADTRSKEEQEQQESERELTDEEQSKLRDDQDKLDNIMRGRGEGGLGPVSEGQIEDFGEMAGDSELGGYPPTVQGTKRMGRTDLDPSLQRGGPKFRGDPGSGIQNSILKSLLKLMKVDIYSNDMELDEPGTRKQGGRRQGQGNPPRSPTQPDFVPTKVPKPVEKPIPQRRKAIENALLKLEYNIQALLKLRS